mgnify:CR=1 FL=1
MRQRADTEKFKLVCGYARKFLHPMAFEKVLIVDDERELRSLHAAFFAQRGFTASTAGSLQEADVAIARDFFDLVILDPPSFARTKQSVPQALAGYKQINLRAMKLIKPRGFLATCSCSHHVGEDSFWQMVQDAARDVKRPLRLIERRSQARDYPVLAAMPETRYLKCVIVQVL